MLKFGEIHMPVPNDYDTYLKRQFGDYMAMPPKDSRHGHLPYLVEFEDGGDKE
jgi:lipopolysaccharide cholinephosphotransferase